MTIRPVGIGLAAAAVLIVAVWFQPTPRPMSKAKPSRLWWSWNAAEKTFTPATAGGLETVQPFDDYQVRLAAGQLTVGRSDHVLWQSPATWQVTSWAIGDINADHVPDLLLSVWKAGDFGPSKPFWLATNDPSVKNHLFVYTIEQTGVHPIWQSSNLGLPNCRLTVADVTGEGHDDLVVLEGQYGRSSCQADHLAVWRWSGFGFTNLWRSPAGRYDDLRIIHRPTANSISVGVVAR